MFVFLLNLITVTIKNRKSVSMELKYRILNHSKLVQDCLLENYVRSKYDKKLEGQSY